MKKAISPLMSTLILVFFAGSLGAVVISWGSANVDISQDACSQVALNLLKIENKPQICTEGDQLRFILENKGEVDISGYNIVIIKDQGIIRSQESTYIAVGDVKEDILKIEGSIRQVNIIPRISQLCAKKSITIESVGGC